MLVWFNFYYHHWDAVLFMVAICLETVIVWFLFSRKQKVCPDVDRINHEGQKVSTPVRPVSIRSNNSTNSENNNKPYP